MTWIWVIKEINYCNTDKVQVIKVFNFLNRESGPLLPSLHSSLKYLEVSGKNTYL